MKRPAVIIGIVVLVLLCALAFGASRLLGGMLGGLTGGGNQPADPNVPELGQFVSALNIDDNGCPTDATDEFNPEEIIYAALETSYLPQGTEMFARLTYQGQPVEDTNTITADQDIEACVYFQFEPLGGGFDPGEYEVELFVNGNPADQTEVTVLGGSAAPGAAPGSGASGVELGPLYATTAVDADGCPTDDTGEFLAGETVYAAYQESFIPAGTELFARLLYEGDPVEDTDPITADQDVQACVWFEFEPLDAAGFDPGDYAVEVYINGQLADQVDFAVR